jgi:hypothetical protein
VLAVTDVRNNAPVAWLAPFIVGLIVVGIGMAWGAYTWLIERFLPSVDEEQEVGEMPTTEPQAHHAAARA